MQSCCCPITDPHPLPGQDILKSLDVVELQLTPNPAYDDKRISVGDRMYVDRLISPWICPITELEMSDRFKIVFLCSSCSVVSLTANLAVGKLLREAIASLAGQRELIAEAMH